MREGGDMPYKYCTAGNDSGLTGKEGLSVRNFNREKFLALEDLRRNHPDVIVALQEDGTLDDNDEFAYIKDRAELTCPQCD